MKKRAASPPPGRKGREKKATRRVVETTSKKEAAARKRRAKKGEPAGPPANRRRQPKKPDKPEPPRPSLRQRARVARQRGVDLWQRVRRPLAVAGKVLVALVLAVGAVGVGKLVERHLRTSPAFATRDLAVTGGERLDRQAILRVAGLAEGQNVFEVAPEDARARLERHPWIAEAHVSRRLPDTLTVEVREHRTAALLTIDGVVYLVSDEGTVFKRAGPEDPADLPVVTGIDRTRFVGDPTWRTSVLLEVVALLHDYRGAGLWRREPIGEVHVESDDGLSLYVGDDALMVRLGHGPYRRKLGKLRRILDRLESEKASAAYVYLDNVRRPDRATVRLR